MTDVFDQLVGPAEFDTRIYGLACAVVTNNKDPDGLGRVKVKLPWLSDEAESNWARVATPMAGANRGVYFLPEVNDEVLVGFEHGSPEFPFVLGALWNGKDKPPANNSDGKNDLRVIKSRSGHLIRLTDTNGAEQIEIVDKSGKNSIVISTKDDTITVNAGTGVTIKSASGKLTLEGNGVEINSTADVKISATSTMELKSNTTLNIKGAQVNIN
jgi:uncharacterized protein involved in type VI secretion and phage assembly